MLATGRPAVSVSAAGLTITIAVIVTIAISPKLPAMVKVAIPGCGYYAMVLAMAMVARKGGIGKHGDATRWRLRKIAKK